MDETTTTFGKALRAERERLGLTQKELADRVGTVQQSVGGWEAGRSLPRQEMFEKLVEVFGAHSPVAALPPRGRLLRQAWATPVDLRHHAPVVEDNVRPYQRAAVNAMLDELDAPMFSRRQMPGPPRPPRPQATGLRAKVREMLRQALPEPLREGVDAAAPVHRSPMRLDYLSDRLCVEIVPLRSHLLGGEMRAPMMLRDARMAMQRLMVCRAAMRDTSNRGERDFLLVLLATNDPTDPTEGTAVRPAHFSLSPGESRALMVLLSEAELLCLHAQVADSVAEVAETIKLAESRAGAPAPLEDYDGYGDF